MNCRHRLNPEDIERDHAEWVAQHPDTRRCSGILNTESRKGGERCQYKLRKNQGRYCGFHKRQAARSMTYWRTYHGTLDGGVARPRYRDGSAR